MADTKTETAAQKMARVAEASRKKSLESLAKQSEDISTETPTGIGSDVSDVPVVIYTQEQLDEQEALLNAGIELGMKWFEEAKDFDAYSAMTQKEQRFSRLLDPLVWSMREALITYEHKDCEDCKIRRETGGNGYALAVAEMLLGSGEDV